MDRNSIKKYALWAREELIKKIALKAEQYGIIENSNFEDIKDFDGIKVGSLAFVEKKRLGALLGKIRSIGYKRVIEEVAYTWFNRFSALRFMEVNGYLSGNIRVFSDEKGDYKPKVELILFQCGVLSSVLPEIFLESEGFTELLLPDGLASKGSVLHKLVTGISEEDWKGNVQIVGWMHQYYHSGQKDKIFQGLKKNIKISKENIPVATQIFTPDWIVRYMVENSLGRLWLEGHNNRELKSSWEYYLEEAKQKPKARAELDKIREEYKNLKPEKIRCIDPCMGCGHILCYIFDILEDIYESVGYSPIEAVESILKNNIYGLDIDEKAANLACFAVMMKARQYDENFFTKNIHPKIYAIKDSDDFSQEVLDYFCNNDPNIVKEMTSLKEQMRGACEFGSLLRVFDIDFELIYSRIDELKKGRTPYSSRVVDTILPLVRGAELLSYKYEVIVTNPPYMGVGGMNQVLATFMKKKYPMTKMDLFAAFMERGLDFARENGYSCMVTMQNWMFIPSFEDFRKHIIDNHSIVGLMNMENMVMGIAFGTSVSVLRKTKMSGYIGNYNYIRYSDLVDGRPRVFPVPENRFAQISSEKFKLIPSSPVAYWVSPELLAAYQKGLVGDTFEAAVGIQTSDNGRFLKYWFEVPFADIDFEKSEAKGYKKRWYPHPKGGAFRKWYGNYDYVVNWQNDGAEIKEFKKSKFSIKKYDRNGICWSHTTNGAFSARVFYRTSIPNLENPVLFCDGKAQKYLLALLNSSVTNYLLNMLNSTMHYHVSDVLNLPLLKLRDTTEIERISDESVELAKSDWDSHEYSWNFKRHPLFSENHNLMSKAYEAWSRKCLKRYNKLKSNEEYLNDIFIKLYGVQNELKPKIEERQVTVRKPELDKDVKSFLSYAVGCMFGRYSLDEDGLVYAGGKWDLSRYKRYVPEAENIITIGEKDYFSNDIVKRLEVFLVAAYGKKTLEKNLNFISNALRGSGTSRQIIRNYFLNEFYFDHCRLYQKRPIYWLFDSGKRGKFKCLIYVHRYKPDIVAKVRSDYILAMQAKYRLMLGEYYYQIGNSEGKDRQRLREAANRLCERTEELLLYEEKLQQLANSMIDIDLNDGIKANHALFQEVLAKIR